MLVDLQILNTDVGGLCCHKFNRVPFCGQWKRNLEKKGKKPGIKCASGLSTVVEAGV